MQGKPGGKLDTWPSPHQIQACGHSGIFGPWCPGLVHAAACFQREGSIRQIQPHFGTLAKLSSIDPPTGTLWSGRSRLGPVGMARHGAQRLAKGSRPYQAIARNTIFKPAVIAPPPRGWPQSTCSSPLRLKTRQDGRRSIRSLLQLVLGPGDPSPCFCFAGSKSPQAHFGRDQSAEEPKYSKNCVLQAPTSVGLQIMIADGHSSDSFCNARVSPASRSARRFSEQNLQSASTF